MTRPGSFVKVTGIRLGAHTHPWSPNGVKALARRERLGQDDRAFMSRIRRPEDSLASRDSQVGVVGDDNAGKLVRSPDRGLEVSSYGEFTRYENKIRIWGFGCRTLVALSGGRQQQRSGH